MGRLYAEHPGDNTNRKFKGRVVFDNSIFRDHDRQVALFQELSSSPATVEAGRVTDIRGILTGP